MPSPLGIGTGNPGVFQGYPHPYPRKPVPVPKGTGMGTGFAKTQGYATRRRVCPQKMTNNLASAVQMSMDTVLQSCKDSKVISNDSGSQTGLVDDVAVDDSMMGLLAGLVDMAVDAGVVNGAC